MIEMLTQEYLKECLHYDQSTGAFTWRERPRCHFISDERHCDWNEEYAGSVAGTVGGAGYRTISLRGRPRLAHRLAFLYMAGKFPRGHMDHINHIRDDNRWSNLREASTQQNTRNVALGRRNKTGVVGVSWFAARGRWLATIGIGGRNKFIGSFKSFDDAVAARKRAEADNGFHQNHGAALPSLYAPSKKRSALSTESMSGEGGERG